MKTVTMRVVLPALPRIPALKNAHLSKIPYDTGVLAAVSLARWIKKWEKIPNSQIATSQTAL